MIKTVKVTHTLELQVKFTRNESQKKSVAFIIYFLRADMRGLLWDIFNCAPNSTNELLINLTDVNRHTVNTTFRQSVAPILKNSEPSITFNKLHILNSEKFCRVPSTLENHRSLTSTSLKTFQVEDTRNLTIEIPFRILLLIAHFLSRKKDQI